jgi:hypothetical protein
MKTKAELLATLFTLLVLFVARYPAQTRGLIAGAVLVTVLLTGLRLMSSRQYTAVAPPYVEQYVNDVVKGATDSKANTATLERDVNRALQLLAVPAKPGPPLNAKKYTLLDVILRDYKTQMRGLGVAQMQKYIRTSLPTLLLALNPPAAKPRSHNGLYALKPRDALEKMAWNSGDALRKIKQTQRNLKNIAKPQNRMLDGTSYDQQHWLTDVAKHGLRVANLPRTRNLPEPTENDWDTHMAEVRVNRRRKARAALKKNNRNANAALRRTLAAYPASAKSWLTNGRSNANIALDQTLAAYPSSAKSWLTHGRTNTNANIALRKTLAAYPNKAKTWLT